MGRYLRLRSQRPPRTQPEPELEQNSARARSSLAPKVPSRHSTSKYQLRFLTIFSARARCLRYYGVHRPRNRGSASPRLLVQRTEIRRLTFSCTRRAIEASESATFFNTAICRQARMGAPLGVKGP